MMDLVIRRIVNEEKLDKERVLLAVLSDCNTGDYILFDTTYDDDGEVSNEVRHSFLFPRLAVKKGDTVRLYTKAGKPGTQTTENGQIYHNFYWGMGETVWNDDHDCALLVEVAERAAKSVGE